MMKLLILLIFSVFCINAEDSSDGNSSKRNISKQELANFLKPILAQKINTKEFEVVVERAPTEEIPQDITLTQENISELNITPQQRNFQISLKLTSGDEVTISGRIEWLASIPVLLRPIGPTEIINLSDVGNQLYPVDQLSALVVMDPQDLVGKAAAHTIIKPGLPVDRSLLKNPTIVKLGDMVDVVYKGNFLMVSAKAQATQDLACGDTGTFETQNDNHKQSPKKISAKVVGPSTAEIIHGFA